MFQRKLMEAEDYSFLKGPLTAAELFDIWWAGDWTHEDVFISNGENSAPESIYFLPETLGKIRPSAKRNLMFEIYRPTEKKFGPMEAVCRNCEKYIPLYVKKGEQFQLFEYGYCFQRREEGEFVVWPDDREKGDKCFVLNKRL